MTGSDVVTWLSVRDVARELNVPQGYIFQLLHATPPRLRAVRTRVGWLIDPQSAAAFQAERGARSTQRQQKASA